MPLNKLNFTTFSFIISKLIFTIIVWVLFFSYDVPYIWETNTTILYNKINTLENQKPIQVVPHYSAENNDDTEETAKESIYDKVCKNNLAFCNTIQTDSTWNDLGFQNYKIATIITTAKINNIIATPYSLSQALENITLKKEDNTNRWYSNHNNIVLNVNKLPYREYMQVLTHELGHIVDLGWINGSSKIKHQAYTEFGKEVFWIDDISLLYYALSRDSESTRNKTTDKKDFCSIYGMSNPFEDFAECFNLYLSHNGYFNYIKKSSTILDQKYTIMAKIFNNEHITQTETNQINKDINERVRDTTKL